MKLTRCIFIILFLIAGVTRLYGQHKNVKVNNPVSTDPEEVTITINYSDPKYIAAGANINYFYISEDSGAVWSESVMNSSLGVWGDPCVMYDGNGYLYYAHLSNPISGYWIDRIVVQRSTDNGKTWNDGAGIGYQYPKEQDKEWLAADMHSEKYKNNIYAAWTEFDKYGSSQSRDSSKILFSYSADFGDTWSNPVRVSDKAGNCLDGDNTTEGAVPAVGPGGEVYISWAGPYGILFDKSVDGGKTFGKDIFVDSIPGGWTFDISGVSRCNGLPVTAADTSHTSSRGNIYINWSDQRNGEANTDIFFSKSVDGGLTWSETKKVNTDNSERHQYFTWMTIDQVTGIIYICFYDRRETVGDVTDFYIARSENGGETFTDFKVSSSSFTSINNVFFGDYSNIAAYNGKIYPIWMRLDGMDLSVITATISDSVLVVSVPEQDGTLSGMNFTLMQNYPNPFNPVTTIAYNLPSPGHTVLEVFDVLGNRAEILADEYKTAGHHENIFNAHGLPSGIYFYRLTVSGTSGTLSQTRKLLLLK